MRIIVAGSKGYIGTAVLLHILQVKAITHVYALSRASKDTPTTAVSKPHSKVTEIQLTDEEFERWPQELLDQFAKVGVRACIWCIGGPPSSFPNTDACEKANIDLPLEAAMALSRSIGPDQTQPFRFIYLSVAGAERNPNVTLWTQAQLRKVKGAAENKLLEVQAAFEAEHGEGMFEVFCLRLGTVLQGGKTTANIIKEGMYTSVNMERFVEVCCEVAMNGWFEDEGGKRQGGVVENAEILGPEWADVNKVPAFS